MRGRARTQDVMDKRNVHECIDIVGDVHGCLVELLELLAALGYRVERQREEFVVTPPRGRTLAFSGDLVDRGPAAPGVLRLAMGMARAGSALCVAGNRDWNWCGHEGASDAGFARHGANAGAIGRDPGISRRVLCFLDALPSHLVLDEGRLVIAHAGLKEALQGRVSAAARAFALHGDLTGKKDALGLPIRRIWAGEYRGKALVVHGHTPVASRCG